MSYSSISNDVSYILLQTKKLGLIPTGHRGIRKHFGDQYHDILLTFGIPTI